MVRLVTSKRFIKDPKDVWGKETTIGLSEHARRMGALATYDKRGEVMHIQTFQSGTSEGWYNTATENGSLSRYAMNGDYSWKMKSGGTTYRATWFGIFNVSDTVGFETALYLDEPSNVDYIDFDLNVFVGASVYRGRVKCDETNNELLVYDNGVYKTFDTSAPYFSEIGTTPIVFHPFKIAMDITNKKYLRFLLDSEEYDLSSYVVEESASGGHSNYVRIDITFRDNGSTYYAYMNHAIWTGGEPR